MSASEPKPELKPAVAPSARTAALPAPIAAWFAARGWSLRSHQSEALDRAQAGDKATLIIAPTGAGKTLAGFLPSLVDLSEIAAREGPGRPHRLHTLYVSPLKALAVDVARSLQDPVAEMGLALRIETRTGDTPAAKRQRQRARPPDVLLTTPEQLSLFLAQENPSGFFADLACVIVDEAHAMAPTKRGDLLALALAALDRWAPGHRRVGLSATVQDPEALARWLAPTGVEPGVVRGPEGAAPRVDVLISNERVPWAGHSGRHALAEVYQAIRSARTTLVFVNTRSQAEMTFQGLWSINDDGLAIALHHGSLDVERRRKVEAAMAAGRLRAVVCTSTLDLGIDWGDVDLVIQMGAPKGSSRLIQRIGRSNHQLDAPSHAVLVPSNRFEALECRAAQAAVSTGDLDGEPPRLGGLDTLAQHVTGRACGEPFHPLALFDEVRRASPYADLDWETFERVLDLAATGGYALRTYDAFKRLVAGPDGVWRPRSPAIAQRHRMNVGAIIESPVLDVRLVSGPPARADRSRRPVGARQGRKLGEIEEYYVESLTPGDTFVFAGEVLRFEGIAETSALVTRSSASAPKVPSWAGGKFPLSTFLAARVRAMIADRAAWADLPAQVREWLAVQAERSIIPGPDEVLIETFPRAGKFYLVAYPFEGRLAHQSLGMLLTRRLERLGKKPMGFVASDYALSIWGLDDLAGLDLPALFDEDMLGDDLDAWLAESVLMKRTFRHCAVIAGLIERRRPGAEKTGRQVTISTDLIYDVLRRHQPDHILLEAAWRDAASGLLGLRRLAAFLKRAKGRLRPIALDRVSPLAVPVMLEIGRERVGFDADDALLAEAESDLVAEAMR